MSLTTIHKPNGTKKQVDISIFENHKQMIEHFMYLFKEKKPKLQKEIDELNLKLKDEKQKNKREIINEIKKLKKEINQINKDTKNYLSINSRYVFDCYEKKKENSENFKIIDAFEILISKNKNKNKITEEKNTNLYNYWKNIKNAKLDINDYVIPADICEVCKMGELISQDDEGLLICNNINCCASFNYIDINAKPQNKEVVNEIVHTAYIRKLHWKNYLMQFEGKQTTNIPDSVLKLINKRIDLMRYNRNEMNWKDMQNVLTMLDLNYLIENTNYLLLVTCNVSPPLIDSKLNEILCHLFQEIEVPWMECCPEFRTNFFHKHYVFYQLCVLLNQLQFLPYIPLLKDREKQIKQDLIWKGICGKLGWEYIPTVP